jgi:hypothetical protein
VTPKVRQETKKNFVNAAVSRSAGIPEGSFNHIGQWNNAYGLKASGAHLNPLTPKGEGVWCEKQV